MYLALCSPISTSRNENVINLPAPWILEDTHLNRHDDSHQGMAEFRYRLSSATSLSASFQRTQRASTVVTRDFNDTIYSLGGSYRF